jgi:hypothetical protein
MLDETNLSRDLLHSKELGYAILKQFDERETPPNVGFYACIGCASEQAVRMINDGQLSPNDVEEFFRNVGEEIKKFTQKP